MAGKGAAGLPGWRRGSTTLCLPKRGSCAQLPSFIPDTASPAGVRQRLPSGNPPWFLRARPFRGPRPAATPAGERGRAGRCCASLGSGQPRGDAVRPSWSRPVTSHTLVPGRAAARGALKGSMSHGARVIRTGVSSGGPAAPPAATAATSSAGSDAELMDGAYFRSCAGLLKVAQMVRGGGRPLDREGVALIPDVRFLWRRVWGPVSAGAGVTVHCHVGRCDFTPQLSQLAGRRKSHGSSGTAKC